MIIYYSATGNCKFVAEQIANATNDKIYSILDLEEITLNENENLGFVFPTYFWGLPSIVEKMLADLKLNSKSSYTFLIATYGTTTGKINEFVNNYFKLNACFKVKMPDTWTPTYDLSNKDKVIVINENEIPQINDIISHIKNRDCGDFIKSKIPMFAVKIARKQYEKARKTSHFKLEDNCMGCRLCQKNCPIKAIDVTDNKPVWIKDKCVMCLACLHHCPNFVIQYENKTKNHGQYTHPK